MFSLFKCNHLNRIDVRIGDGTVKITTILTVRAMLTSKKKYSGGREKNRGGNAPYAPPLATHLYQAQANIISRKKENTKIRKSMPNYEVKIITALRALLDCVSDPFTKP